MKKAALTFGLFSLVMVATSFANPATTNSDITINSLYGDGSASVGNNGGRKLDFQGNASASQSETFNKVSQSEGLGKKLD
ncbi:hypothetical protein EV144_107277 [Flavobacterium sp. 270]|uniref:hypothetical protein n=1 Tax=Flavobacterium sp. 270 TaxID=2512114 RepID=UPI001065D9AF|nr:hypothetical protein [Flavobacterium sp. 270]TDW46083.1 hypothetical protein EV144_107277 [Flavobacterium sp. 270]